MTGNGCKTKDMALESKLGLIKAFFKELGVRVILRKGFLLGLMGQPTRVIGRTH